MIHRHLALATALAVATSSTALAGTLHVPAQFPSIQAAVDAAAPGDGIKIASGNYGPFTVTTDGLKIRAADDDANPTIGYPGFGQVGITIEADRVTVEGLSLVPASGPFGVGFRVTGDDNTLRGNHVTTFLGSGFQALSCNRTVFDGNSVDATGTGTGFKAVGCADEVYRQNSMDGGVTGFQQTGCTNQTYKQNATYNCDVGFQCTLDGGGPTTGGIYRENLAVEGDYVFKGLSDASIRNNTATQGFVGFWLSASHGNDVRGNLASDAYFGSGFILDQGSDLNDLRGNQSIGNAGFGYRVEDMLDNTFKDNVAADNAMGPANQPGIVD